MPLRQGRRSARRLPSESDSEDATCFLLGLLESDTDDDKPLLSLRVPMVHRDKTGAAQLGAGDELEITVEDTTVNTVVPSVTKTGAPQAKSKLHDILCTIFDTQSIISNTEKTVGAILDELVTLNSEIEEQTILSAGLRVALRGQMTKVGLLERERDATLVVLQERERELERMRKDAQDDRKNLEQETLTSLTAMVTEQQRLIVERGELKRERAGLLLLLNKKKATMQCELESALTSTQAGKAKCEILIANLLIETKLMEQKYRLVVGEKDVTMIALADEKAKLMQMCDGMVQMESSIFNLKIENRKLVDQLSMMGKEVDNAKNKTMLVNLLLKQSLVCRRKLEKDLLVTQKDASAKKRKMEEAHKIAFDKVQVDYRRLERSNLELQRREQSMKQKKSVLEKECATIRQELLDEKEKGLCQICVESPKDTMCMPCLHFHYCSTCVENHKHRSRTCPLCRTILSGTLKIDISLQS